MSDDKPLVRMLTSGRQFGRLTEQLRQTIAKFGPEFKIEVYPSDLIASLTAQLADYERALEWYAQARFDLKSTHMSDVILRVTSPHEPECARTALAKWKEKGDL